MKNTTTSLLTNRKFYLIALLFLIVGFLIGAKYESMKLNSLYASQQVTKSDAPAPKATQTLNKSYDFPIKDGAGKEVMKLKYIIETAELNDRILVKGEPYDAISGKTFLILNLKLVNSKDQGVQLPTRDYVRLSTGSNKDLLAADIHNDLVQIQAISTKYTRLAFPIDEKDIPNLTLQVGEVGGKKDIFKLKLK